MAFRRTFRKRVFRRRPRVRRANPAVRMVRQLKSRLALEKKFDDTAITELIDTGASVTSLTSIPQGDTASDRDGGQVKYDSLFMRATVTLPASGIAASARVMLVEDKQPNGAAPTITDVLLSSSPVSLTNMSNSYRFRIHMDKVYNFAAIGVETNPIVYLRKYLKINSRRARYSGASGVPFSGSAFYLMTVGSGVADGTQPTIAGACRIRFYDN